MKVTGVWKLTDGIIVALDCSTIPLGLTINTGELFVDDVGNHFQFLGHVHVSYVSVEEAKKHADDVLISVIPCGEHALSGWLRMS